MWTEATELGVARQPAFMRRDVRRCERLHHSAAPNKRAVTLRLMQSWRGLIASRIAGVRLPIVKRALEPKHKIVSFCAGTRLAQDVDEWFCTTQAG
jgi:hypothetical protein